MHSLFNFYMSLPSVNDYKDRLYIPGYTEAFENCRGSKVIPTADYLELWPGEFKKLLTGITLPAYYAPIRVGRAHYGFILKGEAKATTKFSTWVPLFNPEALTSPYPYVVVTEGIKDAGIFLQMGMPAMAYLTAGMSEVNLQVFAEYGKIPILVPDNDGAGLKGINRMASTLRRQGFPFRIVMPAGHKDTGDWYLPEYRMAVELTIARVVAMAQQLCKEADECRLFTR